MIGDEAAVLIVDDEPGMCWALDHILRRSGIASVTATTGQEALHLAARQRFRLAFVDAKLADAEGLELARRIRAADPGIRIVLVSGYFYGDDPEVLEAAASGVINAFVSKPFLHDEVRTLASAALAP
ncbi:MAG: response regulator [Candidatus Rokubacteria bacterium]|nr:response regulator [Candidatus Rokubacteria bacterium]MBI3077544.1 response regulator [Deltaproteobacteria bacterium]